MSWKEFDLIIKHHSDRRDDEYNRLRILGTWVISPYSKKKVKPKDLLKLPSETRSNPSLAEAQQIISNWNKR